MTYTESRPNGDPFLLLICFGNFERKKPVWLFVIDVHYFGIWLVAPYNRFFLFGGHETDSLICYFREISRLSPSANIFLRIHRGLPHKSDAIPSNRSNCVIIPSGIFWPVDNKNLFWSRSSTWSNNIYAWSELWRQRCILGIAKGFGTELDVKI